MLFKFNELVDGIEEMAIKPGWQLNQGTRNTARWPRSTTRVQFFWICIKT
jgi:hypothetical protein